MITKKEADLAYRSGDPLMTDAEYDTRFGLDASDKDSGASNSIWPKVKLDIRMGSQLKVNSFEELHDWYLKYTEQSKLVASHKMDGSSLELTYIDGVLVRGVTRGDGIIGDDITPNVLKMDLPKTIDVMGKVNIRGEAILTLERWNKHFAGDKNPRNSATGTLRRLDGYRCEFIKFYAFDMQIEGIEFKTKIEIFNTLKGFGFDTPSFELLTYEGVEEAITRTEFHRTELRYEIDGIIVEENNLEVYNSMGITDDRPRAARAFKFKSQKVETILLSITWQVGKTGRLTPVGEVMPVNIGGVTISRVTLDNAKVVEALDLELGCKILLERANDVIPKVVKRIYD